ncbi:MAG: hypothetical protein V9F01_05810 [Chitinophagaceae bacterium]
MNFTKQDLWPKKGKLKKGLIVLAIVIIAALLMTLLEEKTNFKYTKKLTFAIALTCIGVWIYQPKKKEGT